MSINGAAATRSNANFVIQEAVNRGASDIHFEPGPEFGRIRFRIDGVMYAYAADVPAARMDHLINALADLANVNSYELPHAPCDASIDRRVMVPDGRITKTTLRFASSPALYGVDVTIRLNINKFFEFADIGFEEQQLAEIFKALKHKNGIILVTGETGSGKSNTLEAIIRKLEVGDGRKVIQVGDPIEFPNAHRTQIPIKPGCDWDKALKISLRKDPNIFSPGEFRDEQEARMVFRAGRTGHLVPTTVHTNDVATTFDRLTDLGVEPYNQGPSLRLVISQQLVRKLCPQCREPDPLAPLIAQKLMSVLFPDRPELQGINTNQHAHPWLYRAVGCADCFEIGYRGRTVIAEVMRVTPELARLISRGIKGDEIVERAVSDHNMITLAEAAARKLASGVTSFDEVEHLLSEAARKRTAPHREEHQPIRNERARTATTPETRTRAAEPNAEHADAIDAEYSDVFTNEDCPLGL
ncbi:MAG: ATPase, T2SS/T4P/T4SS family [Pyrinomonadaceae bacterium]